MQQASDQAGRDIGSISSRPASPELPKREIVAPVDRAESDESQNDDDEKPFTPLQQTQNSSSRLSLAILSKESPNLANAPAVNRSVMEWCFDDPIRKQSQARCKMIHPRSRFSSFTILFSTIALSYTTVVVPVVIAFQWRMVKDCTRSALLEVDLMFDTFFIIEVVLGFLVADFDHKGKLVDEWKRVARRYVEGNLWFDVFTAIPVSYIELWVLSQCDGESQAGIDPDQWRFARLVKPLRFIRILRVYRALVTVDFSYKLEKLLHVQPLFLAIVRVLLGLVVITHLAACTFWLVKQISNDDEDVEAFLVGQGLQMDSHIIKQYVLACYFIITIFTTVGFGDIAAHNTSEQVVCMMLMTTGVVVFGTLLSEVQSGVAEMRTMAREKGQIIQKLKNYMRVEGVSVSMERRILGWANFDVAVQQQQDLMRGAMERLSDDQRLDLLVHIFGPESEGIALLDLEHPAAQEMQAYVWAAAEAFVFEEGKVISQPGESVHSMLVINKGSVRVEDTEGNSVVTLEKGDSIGAWSLMGDTDAASQYGFPVVFVAATHLHAYVISKTVFQDVLAMCPKELVEEVEEKFRHHEKAREQKELLRSQSVPYRRAVNKWEAIVHKVLKRKGGSRHSHAGGMLGRGVSGALHHNRSYKVHGSMAHTGSGLHHKPSNPMGGDHPSLSRAGSGTGGGPLQMAAAFAHAAVQDKKAEARAEARKDKAKPQFEKVAEQAPSSPLLDLPSDRNIGSHRSTAGMQVKAKGSTSHSSSNNNKCMSRSGSGASASGFAASNKPSPLMGVQGQQLNSGAQKKLDVLSVSADITYGEQQQHSEGGGAPRRRRSSTTATESQDGTSFLHDFNGLLGASDGEQEEGSDVEGEMGGADAKVIDGLRTIDLLSSASIRPSQRLDFIMGDSPPPGDLLSASPRQSGSEEEERVTGEDKEDKEPMQASSALKPAPAALLHSAGSAGALHELHSPRAQEVQSSLTPRPASASSGIERAKSAVVVSQLGPLVSIGGKQREGAGWRENFAASASPTPSEDAFLEVVPGLDDGCRSPSLPPAMPPPSVHASSPLPQPSPRHSAAGRRGGAGVDGIEIDEVSMLNSRAPARRAATGGVLARTGSSMLGRAASGIGRAANGMGLVASGSSEDRDRDLEIAWVRKDVARLENRVSHMDSNVDQLQEDMARMLGLVEEIHASMTAMTGHVGQQRAGGHSNQQRAGGEYGGHGGGLTSMRAQVGSMIGGRPLAGLVRQPTALASIGARAALSSMPQMRNKQGGGQAGPFHLLRGHSLRTGGSGATSPPEDKGGAWNKLRAAVKRGKDSKAAADGGQIATRQVT